ncbi:hypothetical protein ILP97_30120 [Amycolatopsis sp. H6(2020)]|nr:hypothetical protein [Amycolatopsis sp. H6(2020)]
MNRLHDGAGHFADQQAQHADRGQPAARAEQLQQVLRRFSEQARRRRVVMADQQPAGTEPQVARNQGTADVAEARQQRGEHVSG